MHFLFKMAVKVIKSQICDGIIIIKFMSPGFFFVWKVSWFYKKVHDFLGSAALNV